MRRAVSAAVRGDGYRIRALLNDFCARTRDARAHAAAAGVRTPVPRRRAATCDGARVSRAQPLDCSDALAARQLCEGGREWGSSKWRSGDVSCDGLCSRSSGGRRRRARVDLWDFRRESRWCALCGYSGRRRPSQCNWSTSKRHFGVHNNARTRSRARVRAYKTSDKTSDIYLIKIIALWSLDKNINLWSLDFTRLQRNIQTQQLWCITSLIISHVFL